MAKFEINKSTNDQYYFNFKADNGQVIATSETYTTKQSATHAIQIIKEKSANAPIEDNS